MSFSSKVLKSFLARKFPPAQVIIEVLPSQQKKVTKQSRSASSSSTFLQDVLCDLQQIGPQRHVSGSYRILRHAAQKGGFGNVDTALSHHSQHTSDPMLCSFWICLPKEAIADVEQRLSQLSEASENNASCFDGFFVPYLFPRTAQLLALENLTDCCGDVIPFLEAANRETVADVHRIFKQGRWTSADSAASRQRNNLPSVLSSLMQQLRLEHPFWVTEADLMSFYSAVRGNPTAGKLRPTQLQPITVQYHEEVRLCNLSNLQMLSRNLPQLESLDQTTSSLTSILESVAQSMENSGCSYWASTSRLVGSVATTTSNNSCWFPVDEMKRKLPRILYELDKETELHVPPTAVAKLCYSQWRRQRSRNAYASKLLAEPRNTCLLPVMLSSVVVPLPAFGEEDVSRQRRFFKQLFQSFPLVREQGDRGTTTESHCLVKIDSIIQDDISWASLLQDYLIAHNLALILDDEGDWHCIPAEFAKLSLQAVEGNDGNFNAELQHGGIFLSLLVGQSLISQWNDSGIASEMDSPLKVSKSQLALSPSTPKNSNSSSRMTADLGLRLLQVRVLCPAINAQVLESLVLSKDR